MIFHSDMEALRAEHVPEGDEPTSSVQVVSKVLSQRNSNQFLKSVGFTKPTSSKSRTLNESELREKLAVEAAAAIQPIGSLRRSCPSMGMLLHRHEQSYCSARFCFQLDVHFGYQYSVCATFYYFCYYLHKILSAMRCLVVTL
jgi:hypothetical protein